MPIHTGYSRRIISGFRFVFPVAAMPFLLQIYGAVIITNMINVVYFFAWQYWVFRV